MGRLFAPATSLIFEGFGSKLGNRVRDVLKYIFPVPKYVSQSYLLLPSCFHARQLTRLARRPARCREDTKRTLTFVNDGDFISFRHHVFVKTSHKEVQLAEVGPRFEMRRESPRSPSPSLSLSFFVFLSRCVCG